MLECRPFQAKLWKTLIGLFAGLFTVPLTCQSRFYPLLFARFQVEGVSLYFLDDVLGLDLAFETAQGIL